MEIKLPIQEFIPVAKLVRGFQRTGGIQGQPEKIRGTLAPGKGMVGIHGNFSWCPISKWFYSNGPGKKMVYIDIDIYIYIYVHIYIYIN